MIKGPKRGSWSGWCQGGQRRCWTRRPEGQSGTLDKSTSNPSGSFTFFGTFRWHYGFCFCLSFVLFVLFFSTGWSRRIRFTRRQRGEGREGAGSYYFMQLSHLVPSCLWLSTRFLFYLRFLFVRSRFKVSPAVTGFQRLNWTHWESRPGWRKG